MLANFTDVYQRIQDLNMTYVDQSENMAANQNLDNAWLLICGFLVVFMQAGFSVLEAGSVSEKNLTNIL
eukprot:3297839-Rhodomonas_salina.1